MAWGELMVFGPDDQRTAELTLCFFPHVDEFIVVDARFRDSKRPRISVLKATDVLGDEFRRRVESDFSRLLRGGDRPFLRLMGLPQEVEGLIRMHGLRSILEYLGDQPGVSDQGSNSTVAVFFCTGPFLALDNQHMRRAIQKMFAELLPPDDVDECAEHVIRLAECERAAQDTTPGSDVQGMIRGDSDRYGTLWQMER